MNAHWLNDGESILVTGTLDVAEATGYIKATEPDMADFIEECPGRPQRGNIVPQHPEAEYRWMWYANDKGRVRAVTFG